MHRHVYAAPGPLSAERSARTASSAPTKTPNAERASDARPPISDDVASNAEHVRNTFDACAAAGTETAGRTATPPPTEGEAERTALTGEGGTVAGIGAVCTREGAAPEEDAVAPLGTEGSGSEAARCGAREPGRGVRTGQGRVEGGRVIGLESRTRTRRLWSTASRACCAARIMMSALPRCTETAICRWTAMRQSSADTRHVTGSSEAHNRWMKLRAVS